MSELIKVLVLDQWSSTSPDLKNLSLSDFEKAEAPELSGNDANAAVAIFGGERRIAHVSPTAQPYIGTVWMRDDPATGKLVLYRANYDSS